MDFPKKSATYCWEEDDQLQFKQDNQSVHRNHDSKDQNAESLGVSVQTLPLCFSSFKLLRKISEQVVNSEEEKPSDEIVKDVIDDKEAISDPGLQSPSFSDFQSSGENAEPEEEFKTLKCNSVPLVFDSFKILKETLEQMLKDKHIESQKLSCESMKQSCQSFQDPIAAILDNMCSQEPVSTFSYGLKNIYDCDMIRQSASLPGSVGGSPQSPSEHLQSCKEALEDTKSIGEKSSHDVELFEVENQRMGQDYIDPINTYMEKFSIHDPFPFLVFFLFFGFIKSSVVKTRLEITLKHK
jgi:hypothetical protein